MTEKAKKPECHTTARNMQAILEPIESSAFNLQEPLGKSAQSFLTILDAVQTIHDDACEACENMEQNDCPTFPEIQKRIDKVRAQIKERIELRANRKNPEQSES